MVDERDCNVLKNIIKQCVIMETAYVTDLEYNYATYSRTKTVL